MTRRGRCWSHGNSTDMGNDSGVGGTNDTKRPIGKAAVMRAFAASRTRRVGTGSRGRATRANDVGGKTKNRSWDRGGLGRVLLKTTLLGIKGDQCV